MLLPLMEVSNYPADKCDDSDIRGTEALGCLYACVRSCVGVVLFKHMLFMMNVMQKSAKKYKKVLYNTKNICYTYNIRYE